LSDGRQRPELRAGRTGQRLRRPRSTAHAPSNDQLSTIDHQSPRPSACSCPRPTSRKNPSVSAAPRRT